MNELVRWDPFKAALPFESSMFDIVPALLRPAARAGWGGPAMDVDETESAYQLAIELPGVTKEAIQVGIHENSVTIGAERAGQSAQGEESNWLLRERSFGKFSRSLTLPEAVDEDAAEARYVDGVLYLTLKQKSTTRAKRISVH